MDSIILMVLGVIASLAGIGGTVWAYLVNKGRQQAKLAARDACVDEALTSQTNKLDRVIKLLEHPGESGLGAGGEMSRMAGDLARIAEDNATLVKEVRQSLDMNTHTQTETNKIMKYMLREFMQQQRRQATG